MMKYIADWNCYVCMYPYTIIILNWGTCELFERYQLASFRIDYIAAEKN